jgi:hypothetical protein
VVDELGAVGGERSWVVEGRCTVRVKEIEQGPQLVQVVLYGRAGEEEAAGGG